MKIFLGYPSERPRDAEAVWAFLARVGLKIWFDKDSVLPGQDWRREREIAQDDADLILHIISPEVLTRPGEVQRELKRTLDLAEDRPPGDMFFIPIRLDEVVMPKELTKYHYVDFSREDWQYRIAKSIALKFDKAGVSPPVELSRFLTQEATAGGRRELQIRDVSRTRDLQADYFSYLFDDRYFEFINAEMIGRVLFAYYSSRRDWNGPPYEYGGETWASEWSVHVEEFFRQGKLVSIRLQHHYFQAGAAHGNYGASSLNFGGEDIGRFTIGDLFNRESRTLKYLLGFVKLGLQQQMLAYGDDVDFLVDFDELSTNEDDGWRILEKFNFDDRGILFNFSPYDVLAYVFGSHEVRIGWGQLTEHLSEAFRIALSPILRSS